MRALFTFLIIGIFSGHVFASHLLGGEITWECLRTGVNTGKYIFTMKIYRDCNGADLLGSNEIIEFYNGSSTTNFTANFISNTDISPKCYNTSLQVSCANPSGSPAAIEEYLYKTNPVTLTGTPPASGWIFKWEGYARSGGVTNLVTPGSTGFTLRSIMYPYQAKNANPCYDSSPTFAERPSAALPVGYDFTYNHNSNDPDIDSLAYAWANPLDEGSWPPPNVPFETGYSVNSQLPGPAINSSNSIPYLNPETGEITFKSFTSGQFTTVIKVTSFRCGTKIAETFRDVQVSLVVLSATISPLSVTPPFQDANGVNNLFVDTVYAGQLVTIPVASEYFGVNTNGEGLIFTDATSPVFGTNYTATTGCLYPPCATLTPPPSTQTGSVDIALSTIRWQTNCNHITYSSSTACRSFNTYTFVVKTRLNQCPVPQINFSTIRIVVLPPPPLLSPELRCVSVNKNGSTTLNWKPTLDTVGTFNGYFIYTSLNRNGPYTKLDSIFTIGTTTYTHTAANANTKPYYYYISTRHGCAANIMAPAIDTVGSIYLTNSVVGDTIANLKWTKPRRPLLTSSVLPYKIERFENGAWTNAGTSNDTTFTEGAVATCLDTIRYRVSLNDNLTCTSYSNESPSNANPPVAAPQLRCASVSPNGNVTITWTNPTSTSGIFGRYIIYSSNTPAGPFTILDSVSTYTTTNYTHIGANANTKSIYYQIKTESGCAVPLLSVASNTLQTIYLTAGIDITGLIANLSWNPNASPLLGSSQTIYKVERYQTGSWITLTPTSATTFTEGAVATCKDTIRYRVSIIDNLSCTSVSNEAFLNSNTPIAPPEFRCATVAPNGDVTLNWTNPTNTSGVFGKYILFKSNSPLGPFVRLDSNTTYAQTSYTHVGANAHQGSVYYIVKSETNCTVPTISIASDTIKTIYLTAGLNGTNALLLWNSPSSPIISTASMPYQIERYQNSVWAPLSSSSTLTFSEPAVATCYDTIRYRIVLPNTLPCTSYSNEAFLNSNTPITPPQLRCVSVQANGDVNITWKNPINYSTVFKNYYIYSSSFPNGPFVILDTISTYTQNNYTHVGAVSGNSPKFYMIRSETNCVVPVLSSPSNIMQSILLTVSNNISTATLTFSQLSTPLLSSSTGVYNIYKKVGVFGSWISNGSGLGSPIVLAVMKGCRDTIYYKLEVIDSLCTSKSTESYYVTDVGIEPPQLHCLKVLGPNQIQLNWDNNLISPGSFAACYIYRGLTAGGGGAGYTLIDSVKNYTTTTYTDNVVASTNGQIYYYNLKSRTSCGTGGFSPRSPELSTMILSATANSTKDLAQLSWNAPSTPLLATASPSYNVFREDTSNVGTYIQIATTSLLNYNDAVNVCNRTLNYRVELSDNLPCTNVSNIDGDYFTDNNKPTIPILDSVSIDPISGKIQIGWQKSSSIDTWGYIIYSHSGTSIFPIDTVWGINNTKYLVNKIGVGGERYSIAAFDYCGKNTSNRAIAQQTIKLGVRLDMCDGTMHLTWSQYRNWKNKGINGYKVYCSINNAPMNLLVTTSTTDTMYVHDNLIKNSMYCYYVRAIDSVSVKTSTSNDSCMYSAVPNQPEYAYAIYATVRDSATVEIAFTTDLRADITGYNIYRSSTDTNSASYSLLGTVSGAAVQAVYKDLTAKTNQRSYFYKTVVLDSCGIEGLSSNHARTIFLSVEKQVNLLHHLSWNPYTYWEGGVESYHVYRIIDDKDTMLVGKYPGETKALTDNATKYTDGKGKFCYYVKATEGLGNPYGFTSTSKSNITCLQQSETEYLPNAFDPGDIFNPIYKPILVFANITDYSFEIFNRCGQIVFESTDKNIGWDGTWKGKDSPIDVYAYRLYYNIKGGDSILKNGTLTLIR